MKIHLFEVSTTTCRFKYHSVFFSSLLNSTPVQCRAFRLLFDECYEAAFVLLGSTLVEKQGEKQPASRAVFGM